MTDLLTSLDRWADINGEPLPEWVTSIRPWQVDAAEEAIEAFTDDRKSVVFMDAPTGSGKSLIAELVRRGLQTRGLDTCTTKALQDQFAADFDYGAVLKGKANYVPAGAPPADEWNAVTCEDCTDPTGAACQWCDSADVCPYQIAKEEFRDANVGIINTSFLLTAANRVNGGLGRYTGIDGRQPFIIADECDVLEETLSDYAGLVVPRKLLTDVPKKGAHKPTIINWLRGNDGRGLLTNIERRNAMLGASVQDKRERRRNKALIDEVYWIVSELERELTEADDAGSWIRDYPMRDDEASMILKPVMVGEYGSKLLWRHASRWMLMSGTIISSEQMAFDLGLKRPFTTVTVPMMFPVENRPIRVAPVADMANKVYEVDKLATTIERVCEREEHRGQRILVHTNSYKLAKELAQRLSGSKLKRKIITYSRSDEKESAMNIYAKTAGAVMLAPSMDRGIDFKGDLARVVIVAKMPFPYLGDRQVKARLGLPGGNDWYATRTVRTVVQMTGRGVRSVDDHATTYILDRMFVDKWRQHRNLYPDWWTEALDWKFPVRELK